jgi:hypothetical protein
MLKLGKKEKGERKMNKKVSFVLPVLALVAISALFAPAYANVYTGSSTKQANGTTFSVYLAVDNSLHQILLSWNGPKMVWQPLAALWNCYVQVSDSYGHVLYSNYYAAAAGGLSLPYRYVYTWVYLRVTWNYFANFGALWYGFGVDLKTQTWVSWP